MAEQPGDITMLLQRMAGGDAAAREEVYARLSAELRRIAEACLRSQTPGGSLQTTALIDEAYIRLLGATDRGWETRTHFLNVAARAMRQILVDHARARGREKRGGSAHRLSLDQVEVWFESKQVDILDLHAKLEELEKIDPRAVRVAEVILLAGLGQAEAATLLGIPLRTLQRSWEFARTWLARELRGDRGE